MAPYLMELTWRLCKRVMKKLKWLRKCYRKEVPTQRFTMKKLHRRQLLLGPSTMVVGDLTAMNVASNMMNKTRSTPTCLLPIKHKKVFEQKVWSLV